MGRLRAVGTIYNAHSQSQAGNEKRSGNEIIHNVPNPSYNAVKMIQKFMHHKK